MLTPYNTCLKFILIAFKTRVDTILSKIAMKGHGDISVLKPFPKRRDCIFQLIKLLGRSNRKLSAYGMHWSPQLGTQYGSVTFLNCKCSLQVAS